MCSVASVTPTKRQCGFPPPTRRLQWMRRGRWTREQILAPGQEHSGEIIAELEYSDTEIAEMAVAGLIIDKPVS